MLTEEIKEILKFCTRCGKCVPVCPSYQVYKSELFSPRGRIFLTLKNQFHETFYFCLLCGRCENTCPNGVSFPEAYIEILKEKKENSISKELLKKLAGNPLKTFLELNNWLHLLPLKEKRVSEKTKQAFSQEGEITIYYSCGLKYLYPEVLEKVRELLERVKIKATMPEEVDCCGAIFLNLGYLSLLKEKALKNLKILEKTKGPILIFCATCLWIFKKVYPEVFKGSVYEERFKNLAERVTSAYNYFIEVAPEEMEKLREQSQKSNTLFHLSCHLTEDFNLVKNKLEVKKFCCGSPKAFLWLKGFQEKYKKEWFRNLEKINILATFCTGCYLNFKVLLKGPPQIKHWFELL